MSYLVTQLFVGQKPVDKEVNFESDGTLIVTPDINLEDTRVHPEGTYSHANLMPCEANSKSMCTPISKPNSWFDCTKTRVIFTLSQQSRTGDKVQPKHEVLTGTNHLKVMNSREMFLGCHLSLSYKTMFVIMKTTLCRITLFQVHDCHPEGN